jgi:hypothetical protein
MQKLAGLITESELKQKLNENESTNNQGNVVDFLNSNFKEVISKLGNPGSKFKYLGDPKVATAGTDDGGIDISFDEEHMFFLQCVLAHDELQCYFLWLSILF